MAVSISMTLLACGSSNSIDTSSTKEDNSGVKVEEKTTTDTKDLETLEANNQVVTVGGMTIYLPKEWTKANVSGFNIKSCFSIHKNFC